MLEGLEISEVRYSDIMSDVETIRLDSEYHKKEFIYIDELKKAHQEHFCKFSDYNVTIDCSAFYPGIEQFYGCGKIPLIRVQNIKNGVIDYDSCATLPQLSQDYSTLKWVKEGDIVITKGGSIGFTGYVTKDALASRDLIFIKSSHLNPKISKFIYLYFSTNFAFKQLVRSSSQCAQPHLTITLVKNFDIIKLSDEFIQDVSNIYDHFTQNTLLSKKYYAEAENILCEALGLNCWLSKNSTINVKTLRSTFLSSGRLDAEYYQTKFDDLFELLSKYDCDTLDNLVNINKSVEPGSDSYQDKGIPFIRVQDLSMYGISETDVYLSPKEFSNIIRPKKDTILLSKDGSVGIAYKVEEDSDYITSGAILHLSIKKETILPDYLTLVLNSKIVQMQAERDAGGSIIQHWKPSEIKRVVIPILPLDVQKNISEKIKHSFALRKEANNLLVEAKNNVEHAISAISSYAPRHNRQ